ncbi:sensor histidine kinase [Amycolatopsis pithecellobii]|uniref:histidine kinase n=1 Tax=Amycolatopsis pithecellobii TaxID=664692 RepID=A0A6N7YLL1_9PSEU|nr:HAMP domain-containing sensor histidine kinase [Amycolatopsis pithecellobii]MTD53815.1 HAMP domain-containing protein [Amycolatopsis pithecellobii]
MLNRLGIRWKLTLLQTGLFLVAGAVVVTLAYFENQVVIMPARFTDVEGETPVPELATSAGPTGGVELWRRTTLSSLLLQWTVALSVMTLLAGFLAWWATGRVLNRVQRMTAQARGISTANLHERIGVEGPQDEIKELSDTFDDLLTRLDDAFHAQGRFIANASHELRTPLAVARTTIQVGLSSTDPKRVERVRRELLHNNDRCVALINGLLTLAHCEQGLHRREAVALDEVARRVVADRPVDDSTDGSGITLHASEVCRVWGDSVLLSQLVHNLVDNAVRYNVPGGHVLIEVHRDGRLRVGNTGPMVGPNEVAGLFEPFRRGAGRVGTTDGAGLGLSIVRAIVRAHEGRIDARAKEDGGLLIDVALPPSRTYVTSATMASPREANESPAR